MHFNPTKFNKIHVFCFVFKFSSVAYKLAATIEIRGFLRVLRVFSPPKFELESYFSSVTYKFATTIKILPSIFPDLPLH